MSPLSSGVVYTFQVRHIISKYCGGSMFWSEWSDPVQWNDNKGTEAWGCLFLPSNLQIYLVYNILSCLFFFVVVINPAQPQMYWHVLGFVLGVNVLIILSLLLCFSER